MGDTILRVDDIQKFYGNKGNLTKAIDHLSFSVRKGEFLGIMGASGSGKTTLLNCISTIDTVTSGHIYVEEKDITMLHRAQLADFRGKKLGFIFQNFNLLDTLTAYENISLALSIVGAKPSEIEQRIPQIAQALNIQDISTNIGLTIVLFLLVYGSYFLATYLSCKRIVTEQRELEV